MPSAEPSIRVPTEAILTRARRWHFDQTGRHATSAELAEVDGQTIVRVQTANGTATYTVKVDLRGRCWFRRTALPK